MNSVSVYGMLSDLPFFLSGSECELAPFLNMIQGYEDKPSDKVKGPPFLFTCYTELFITFLAHIWSPGFNVLHADLVL